MLLLSPKHSARRSRENTFIWHEESDLGQAPACGSILAALGCPFGRCERARSFVELWCERGAVAAGGSRGHIKLPGIT